MDGYINELWETALLEIQEKINKPSFETCLKLIKPVSLQQNTFFLSVPNDFTKNWIESRFSGIINDAVNTVTKDKLVVQFITTPASPEDSQEKNIKMHVTETEKKPAKTKYSTWLNPKYTFESFVIGDSNSFAHAASLAVAETPSKAYNPLFIYGGVGLGKTHLMHAIGHYVLANSFNYNVVYTSSETFTNEFINAIRDNKTVSFRNKYRNIDVLLIDDIQFLAGKEQTQEEFFHTFNALHENNKQIIISSDRPPKEIPTLEERLRSRFEWGLLTDIQPPDLETRVAILRKKAKQENCEIPNEVIYFIADQVNSNIRELEGAFIRVIAYSSLSERNMCIELAKEALKDLVASKKENKVTIKLIQQITSDYYNVSLQEMIGKKRNKSLSLPRQIAMYLAREMTEESFPHIGGEFGGKDHTTILHGYNKIKKEMETNPNLRSNVENLKRKILNK